MDWNPVIHLLDELRDGPCSMLELDSTISRYERPAVVQTLLYLADRELIELTATRHPFAPIPKAESQRRLREAFGSDRSDPVAMAETAIDLSKEGVQVLQLFGIGYP